MKKIILIIIFGLFCNFFIGCHTLHTLSRIHTGHVDLKDICDAIIADDRAFQEKLW